MTTKKNKITKNKWTRELAKVCQWDPREEGLEPHVSIDIPAILRLAEKKIIEEQGEGARDAMTKANGTNTLYKALDKHHMSNVYVYLCDLVTYEDLLSKTKEPLNDVTKKHPLFFADTIKGYTDLLREVQVEVTDLGLTVEVSTPIGLLQEIEDESKAKQVDELLSSCSLPALGVTYQYIQDTMEQVDQHSAVIKTLESRGKDLSNEVERLSAELSTLAAKQMAATVEIEIEESHDGTIPSGKVVMKNIGEVFPDLPKSMQRFEVQTMEWDGVHPNIPKVDEHYIFRDRELLRVLYAIAFNKRAWLQGHTGSGKTTLVEQVAARLGLPVTRVNFDSEISRGDLMGRDTLKSDPETGATISEFVEGILPRAMAQPGIFLADEMDFVRADVSYVLQAALEGNNLRLAEDGDRIVKPHPMFRMFATANTVGQGDEQGMYQGARSQSLALLDRFTVWINVEYMNDKQRDQLVSRTFPSLKEDMRKQLNKYMKDHINGFINGDIVQPISPRGMLSVAQAAIIMDDMKAALEMTVIDKASNDDKPTLMGLVDRICA